MVDNISGVSSMAQGPEESKLRNLPDPRNFKGTSFKTTTSASKMSTSETANSDDYIKTIEDLKGIDIRDEETGEVIGNAYDKFVEVMGMSVSRSLVKDMQKMQEKKKKRGV